MVHGGRGERRKQKEARWGRAALMAVDIARGTLYHDTEMKDKLAASISLQRLGRKIDELDDAIWLKR